MNTRVLRNITLMLAAVVLTAAGTAGAQVRAYGATDAQVRSLIRRIETRTDNFRRQVERVDNRTDRRQTSELSGLVNDFEASSDRLRSSFNSRRSTSDEVREVLGRATVIDRYITSNRFNANVTNQWSLLRSDLNTLASYYRVSFDWNNPGSWNGGNNDGGNNNGGWNNGGWQNGGIDARLTGTFQLNSSQSDNISSAIDRSLGASRNDRQRQNLERRLTSPEMLVIDKRGNDVTMGSTLSQRVTFVADGTERSETNANGRTMSVRAKASRSDMTIEYEGDRMNDFYLTFTPLAEGRLRVTRRIYLEGRSQTVTVNSLYDRVDNVARWDRMPSTFPNYPSNGGYGGTTNVGFAIADNTRVTAVLDSAVSTRTFRDGDRFTMTVSSPSEYRGAVIAGRVNGSKSGVVSGRANLAFDFDTIRLRDGSTYRFAGIVDQVREPDGDLVNVNNEGVVRDGNQTTKTVTRAGIGAALGALIGAIAGGGEGAAIGAGVGAGAGAGSVVLQGRDNIELPSGTEFTLTAAAPRNR